MWLVEVPLCMELACSPRVGVGFLRVLRVPPTLKDMQVRLVYAPPAASELELAGLRAGAGPRPQSWSWSPASELELVPGLRAGAGPPSGLELVPSELELVPGLRAGAGPLRAGAGPLRAGAGPRAQSWSWSPQSWSWSPQSWSWSPASGLELVPGLRGGAGPRALHCGCTLLLSNQDGSNTDEKLSHRFNTVSYLMLKGKETQNINKPLP